MRMLRVALVLFVLASFVAATAAVSMAATVTPVTNKTVKPTMKPVASMMPTKKPSKMIDLTQMKANVDAIYKKLKTNTKMPGANNTTTRAAKTATATPVAGMAKVNNTTAAKTAKVTSPTAIQKPAKMLSTPEMRAMPSMAGSNVNLVPQLAAKKATVSPAPGKKLAIGLG